MEFDGVVFAGGGARCFWQAGFWLSVESSVSPPTVVGAVSGGAAIAAILFSGAWGRFFPKFLDLVAECPGNVRIRNLLSGSSVFPHREISRESFLHAVSMHGLRQLRDRVDFRIVLSHPPRILGSVLGPAIGAVMHRLESRLTSRIYPKWSKVVGFRPSVVRAHQCGTPEELVDAILQSSTVPPFFPVTRRNGLVALDGGLVENVPLFTVSECRRPLVLLSHHEAELSPVRSEVYACPSDSVPIRPWDFASPEKVMETFELGRTDGERFIRDFSPALNEMGTESLIAPSSR